MRKRLFSFAAALLTVVLMLPAGVFAEGTDVEVDLGDLYNMQFLVETVTVGNDDETAVVNISIEKNGGFAAMNYMLLFDKDVLSLEEQPTPSSAIKDGYIGGPLEDGKHMGIFSSPENILGDGVILTYTFKINPEVMAGTYEVKLLTSGSASLPDGSSIDLEVLDEDFNKLATTVTDGSVTVPGYKVSYDANGGIGAPEGVIKSKNKPVTISSVKPEREGFAFLGWATTSGAVTAEYVAGQKYTENKDVVLYAVWEKLDAVAGNVDITVSTIDAKQGDVVEVVISLANHPGIESMQFDVEFDNTRLKYESAVLVRQDDPEVTLDQFMFMAPNPAAVTNKMTIALTTGVKNLVGDGELLKITFKVLDEAEDGFADISVVSVEASKLIDLNSGERAKVIPNIVNGGVSLVSQLLGDVNADGVVDVNDAILLLQYSMFPDLFPLDYKGSVDFVKDGSVDVNDAILLLQHSMFPDLFPLA